MPPLFYSGALVTGALALLMIILGIDTSTNCGSVAVTDKDNLLSESSIPSSHSYSRSLIGAIDELLKKCGIGIGDIDGYAVSIGPGSFTGLRIGLSTCKGFNLATGRPIIPVDTMDAMVDSISSDSEFFQSAIFNLQSSILLLCPVIDARKEEIYTALYKYKDGKVEKIADETAVTPEKRCQAIDRPTIFFGDGLRAYGDFIKSRLKGLACFYYDDMPKNIASSIAFMGAKKLERGDVADPVALKPKYIRRSEAEIKWEGEK
jgi:tRNA threonylcarbamoyladenosine biosynthesis protein TsaB